MFEYLIIDYNYPNVRSEIQIFTNKIQKMYFTLVFKVAINF